LDSRTRDGIYVQLLWHPLGSHVSVAVADTKTGAAFELELGHGQRALDVYHHPYADAARHVHSMTDGGSRACDPTAAERLEPEIIGDATARSRTHWICELRRASERRAGGATPVRDRRDQFEHRDLIVAARTGCGQSGVPEDVSLRRKRVRECHG
jgi:hypothetical protein